MWRSWWVEENRTPPGAAADPARWAGFGMIIFGVLLLVFPDLLGILVAGLLIAGGVALLSGTPRARRVFRPGRWE